MPGKKTDPARHADRVLNEVVVEAHALAGEPIQIGRFYIVVAIKAQRVPSLLVSVKNEDVGSFHIVLFEKHAGPMANRLSSDWI